MRFSRAFLHWALVLGVYGMKAQSPGGMSINLVSWFKADAGLSGNGSSVTSWPNQVSGGISVSNQVAGNPVYYSSANLQNFNPVVRFNGGGDLRNTTQNVFNGNTIEFQMIVVAKRMDKQNTAWRSMMGNGANGNNPGMDLQSNSSSPNGVNFYADCNGGLAGTNSTIYSNGGTGAGSYGTTGNVPSAGNIPSTYSLEIANMQPQIFATSIAGFSFSGSSTCVTGNKVWVDGHKTTSGGRTYRADWVNAAGFYIGSSNDLPWLGDVDEVIVYNAQLSDAGMQRINSYLAIKWGITLGQGNNSATTVNVGNNGNNYDYVSSSGAVVWNATSNSGFSYNIGGIARDDNSGLRQLQSSSVNAGTQVLIGNGSSLWSSNASNTNSLSVNQSFEIWGDNGSPLTYSVGISGNSSINYRLARVWKVQESGTVGNVTIAWPVSAPNVCLVTNPSDPTFSTGNTVTPLSTTVTINGTSYYTATVDLSNNSYFTFGAFLTGPGGVTNGLAFWAKADNNTGSGAWPDNSLNKNPIETSGTMTISSANSNHNFQPYYTSFSSSNFFLENTCSFAANNAYTEQSLSTFNAVRLNGSTSAGRITGIDNDLYYAGEPYLSLTSTGNPSFYKFTGNTRSFNHSSSINTNQSALVHFVANDASKQLQLGFNHLINSTSWSSDQFGDWGPYLQIGYGTWDLSGAFPGDIMEVAWYTRALSATEQLQVNSYMGLKYGIAMDQTSSNNYIASDGSTVVWNTSTQTGYNNAIIGIGRDDYSTLLQKQSYSATASDILTLYLGGTKYSDNASNGNTFTGGDKSYFVCGHSGQTVLNTSWPHVDRPSGIYSRLKRQWKTQQTNFTNTNLSIEFDLTGYAIGPLNAADLRLMTDDDGTFASGSTLYGNATSPAVSISVSGQIVTITGVNASWFNSSPYFSLGSVAFTTPLPVELLYFTAQCQGGHNQLTWATASEKNNRLFVIEKSTDGFTFKPIGQVNGQGTSNQSHSYSFDDSFRSEDLVYYRLKQQDYNNKEENSAIIYAENCGIDSGDKAYLYPNPINDGSIHLVYSTDNPKKIRISIYDMLGESFYENHEDVTEGTTDLVLDLPALSSGMYFLKIDGQMVQKFVRQ